MPVENDKFIISHKGVDTLTLMSLKILLGILKGPFDLLHLEKILVLLFHFQ